MIIRLAELKDSGTLLNIYAQYINSPITFEYTLPTEEVFSERIQSILKCYPYLVCQKENKIIGYAYAHLHMERAAYQWNAELSIYIARDGMSQGVGKRLYSALIDILKLQGVRTVYGAITLPNIQSEALHKSLGFEKVGIYHNTGYKNSQWYDVVWYEKDIGEYGHLTEPITPIHDVSMKNLQDIFALYC